MVLIVFEGGDRCGKSTQCNLLYERLSREVKEKNRNETIRLLKYPGNLLNKYLKRDLELDPMAASLVFASNLWEIDFSNIKNEIIIMDRYVHSSIAYSTARGISMMQARDITNGLPEPDLIFYFEIDKETMEGRNEFGMERFENSTFQSQVYKVFNKLKSQEEESMGEKGEKSKWHEIDCRRTIQEIHQEISQIVHANLNL